MSQKPTRSHAAVVRALQKTQKQRETREAEMEVQDSGPSTLEIFLGENPTPQERGTVIVKRLEQYIREGRSDQGGIPFRRWQELAVYETTNAILDAEKYWRKDHRFIDRGLLVGRRRWSRLACGALFWRRNRRRTAKPRRSYSSSLVRCCSASWRRGGSSGWTGFINLAAGVNICDGLSISTGSLSNWTGISRNGSRTSRRPSMK